MDTSVNSKAAREKINALRQKLSQAGQRGVEYQGEFTEINELDEQMLSIIIGDLLQGIEVESRYPAYFQKLEEDAVLRAAFLENLDILEKNAFDMLEPLPLPASRDLSFLQGAKHHPAAQQTSATNWQITLTQMAEYIQKIFFLSEEPALPVYRSEAFELEETVFELLQSEIDIESRKLLVRLEAMQPIEPGDVLQAWVNLTPQTGMDLAGIQARLNWGEYSASAQFNETGQGRFPEIPFAQIMELENDRIRGDLQLVIELARRKI